MMISIVASWKILCSMSQTDASKTECTTKTVLIMGAGLVTRPLVHYLAEHGFRVICGSRGLEKAQALCKGAPNAEARALDIERPGDIPLIEEAVKESSAVISMLPYLLHAALADIALRNKKHFLTTSYVSDAMKELEPRAKEAGVMMMNECGVDPGTDHMSAMKVFDEVHEKGGKIVSFLSYCGGLPAPESNNNPLGYKFSWAPRGVLLASRNPATYLKDGKEVTIPGKELFASYMIDHVEGMGEFECYPNRNSCQYLDIYPLRGECQTIIRGTYRNKGWCDAIKALADLDYISLDERELSGKTFADLTRELIGSQAKDGEDLQSAVAEKLKVPKDDHRITTMNWLGLFEATPIDGSPKTPLDALCANMMSRMEYKDGERDMICLQHTFTIEYPDKNEREVRTSRLIDYGQVHGDSSMSRTVSLPVAIVCRLLLEGRYDGIVGLQRPLEKHYYEPVLKELAELGINFVEKVEKTEPIDA